MEVGPGVIVPLREDPLVAVTVAEEALDGGPEVAGWLDNASDKTHSASVHELSAGALLWRNPPSMWGAAKHAWRTQSSSTMAKI